MDWVNEALTQFNKKTFIEHINKNLQNLQGYCTFDSRIPESLTETELNIFHETFFKSFRYNITFNDDLSRIINYRVKFYNSFEELLKSISEEAETSFINVNMLYVSFRHACIDGFNFIITKEYTISYYEL